MTSIWCGFRTPSTALALTLLALTGCGDRDRDTAPGSTAATDTAAAERGGTAVIADSHDLQAPTPLTFTSVFDADLVDIMYMGLTRLAWGDGKLTYLTSDRSPMALAWHYEYTGKDSASLRFRMKSGLKWSDGMPITARDVVWTYDMLGNPKLASARQGDVEPIDSVVAENDSVVVFHFKRRFPGMLFASSSPIAPRHVYEKSAPEEIVRHPTITSPAGALVVSGPFQIGQWEREQRIILTPNRFFPVQPRLDRIVIRVIPDPTTRMVELQTGQVDMMRQIPFDQVKSLRERAPNLRFEREEKRYYEYIAYNPLTVPAFTDPDVRRALGMALDVPGMIRGLGMEEFAVPAWGPYPPIFRALYDPARMKPLAFDTAGAKRILAQKGWKDTNGDGIVEKDGKPLRFTLLTNSGNARRADVVQIAQQQWKQIGVDVRLQSMETNTYFDRQKEKKFEALLGSWGVGLNPDVTPLWRKGSLLNIVSYHNPAVERSFDEALAQPTEAAASRGWKAAAEEIVKDQPYTFLYYYDMVDGVNNRLRGTKIDTFGAYQNVWEWWIPKALQGATAAGAAPAPPRDTTAR